MSRVFNKEAYNNCDAPAKKAAIKYLEKKGFYLISDLDKEYYKRFDCVFINSQGMVIKIENEFRGKKFNFIKEKWHDCHIPIRKKNTECDFYFFWGPEFKEIGIIKRAAIIKYRDNPKIIVCAKGKPHEWQEEFICIPVKEIHFRKIND